MQSGWSWASNRVEAVCPAIAKHDTGNPHEIKRTAAGCSHVLRCVLTARISPGRLAASHLGLPRTQQQARFKLVSSCRGASVCLLMRGCIRGCRIKKISQTAVQLVFRFGISAVDSHTIISGSSVFHAWFSCPPPSQSQTIWASQQ